MTECNKLHVVVGVSSWNSGSIKYRRHHLTEYLKQRDDTDKVYWVYPVVAKPGRIASYSRAIEIIHRGIVDLDYKLTLCGFPDLVPTRLQRHFKLLQLNVLRKLKNELNEHEGEMYLWFTAPVYSFMAKAMVWDRIIYDCSDLWGSSIRPDKNKLALITNWLLRRSESKIVRASDLVFATSDYLAERIEKLFKKKVLVFENGVDFNQFKANCNLGKSILKEIPKPRLVFIGGMKAKIDFALLKELAEKNPGWSVILIGPEPTIKNKAFDDLLLLKNVYWLGQVEPGEVPSYLHDIDVGLLPYKEDEYNEAVFPLKFFEYLAAGLPVVGCGISSTSRFSKPGIYVHTSRDDFIAACRIAVSWAKDENIIMERVNIARDASWSSKFNMMFNEVLKRRF